MKRKILRRIEETEDWVESMRRESGCYVMLTSQFECLRLLSPLKGKEINPLKAASWRGSLL